MNIRGTRTSQVVVQLTPSVRHRAEIGQRADDLAHDLMVLLRRESGDDAWEDPLSEAELVEMAEVLA